MYAKQQLKLEAELIKPKGVLIRGLKAIAERPTVGLLGSGYTVEEMEELSCDLDLELANVACDILSKIRHTPNSVSL